MSKDNLKSKNPYLSVIIPLYNEEDRLKNAKKIYKYLNRLNINYDVILVNDGSNDSTIQKLNKLLKSFPFTLISYKNNQGKGFAIKKGMLKAKGKYILFIDIDLSTPIEEISKFLPHLGRVDCIIGSRKTKGAKLNKRQVLFRELLGKGFTLLSQQMLNLQVSDFTCGFKCFSRKAARSIFAKQQIRRWGFDSEILFLAKKLGFRIKEIPVRWSNDPRTRVKFPKDLIESFVDLCRIRLNNFFNPLNNNR